MFRNIKMVWISALRGGEYAQGKGFERCQIQGERVLHDPLGVLAELCEYETGEVIFSEVRSAEGRAAGAEYVTNWDDLCTWAGMDEGAQYGRGEDGKLISELIDASDDGEAFEDLARRIERTLGPGWDEED